MWGKFFAFSIVAAIMLLPSIFDRRGFYCKRRTMNSFFPGNLLASFIIHKNGPITGENLIKCVEEKIPDRKEAKTSFSLVYVFYLVDKQFAYPKDNSDVLYIGKTKGEKRGKDCFSAAFRFAHLKDGLDAKQNATLRAFYDKGDVIGLDIFEVDNCDEKEKELRRDFLKKFGACPIADGASFKK